MAKQGADPMAGAPNPRNMHMVPPTYATVPGSQEQPVGVSTYPASSTVFQYRKGGTNLQNPLMANQNPLMANQNPAVKAAQSQPAGLQYPVGTVGVQTPPGAIQYSPNTINTQIPPGDPQNPRNPLPGSTQTPGPPTWNMSFVSFPPFDPKKFINEEVRTLGAIQILIGLFHIFSGINPILYEDVFCVGVSGYLFWGGLSFIISGSLSIIVEKNHNDCMVSGSIGMNVFSSIVSLCGILLIIIQLSVDSTSHNPESSQKSILLKSVRGISGSLLPFALLEFILTCTTSHFGCEAVCWPHFEKMTVVSSVFGTNTASTATGPINTTMGPINTTMGPINNTMGPINNTMGPMNTTMGPMNTTMGPINTTNRSINNTMGPINTTNRSISTTTGPINAATGPINTTTDPTSATPGLSKTTFHSSDPHENTYEDVAVFSQR